MKSNDINDYEDHGLVVQDLLAARPASKAAMHFTLKLLRVLSHLRHRSSGHNQVQDGRMSRVNRPMDVCSENGGWKIGKNARCPLNDEFIS
ncbi:hypothetical protein INS49_002742 [Diaporthe citri]|uniref:uncharacterized protein n=1 Tax=Diaporthe citri TaxID=83186 RepID=UPI001C80D099|nr:uncharacterized protein INS49_002742 [Diaporthe citri]KAG6368531.1 hypothetical protein INS49_002742 [Diaporthe citri]